MAKVAADTAAITTRVSQQPSSFLWKQMNLQEIINYHQRVCFKNNFAWNMIPAECIDEFLLKMLFS